MKASDPYDVISVSHTRFTVFGRLPEWRTCLYTNVDSAKDESEIFWVKTLQQAHLKVFTALYTRAGC